MRIAKAHAWLMMHRAALIFCQSCTGMPLCSYGTHVSDQRKHYFINLYYIYTHYIYSPLAAASQVNSL